MRIHTGVTTAVAGQYMMLQLFADGGDGGAGGTGGFGGEGAAIDTGVTGVDAEHQRLRELGVPESKIAKHKRAKKSTLSQGAVKQTEQTRQADNQAAAGDANEGKATDSGAQGQQAAPTRMTWSEIMADPEYNGEVQKIVSARVNEDKSAKKQLETLIPALELLARQYDLDPANMDYNALAQRVADDDRYYEDKALSMGVPVETAKKIDQQEREGARQQRQQQDAIFQEKLQKHVQKMRSEEAELKEEFPDFDLQEAMRNEQFARLCHPDHGVGVKAAYYALNHAKINAARDARTAQQVRQMAANSIQSGQMRPAENGSGVQAHAPTTYDPRKMTVQDFQRLKREVERANRRGQKIYPGQI